MNDESPVRHSTGPGATLLRLRPKGTVLALLLLLALGFGILLVWLGPSQTITFLRHSIEYASSIVSTVPAWAFALFIALACAFPIPSGPFFIAAGLAYPPLEATLATCLGLLGNLLFSYWLAARAMRKPVEAYIERRGLRLPTAQNIRPIELILMVRFIPALPLVLQSYLLGLLKVPLIPYMLLSWPLACLGAVGLVLAGRGFYEGNAGVILFAASWIIFLSLAIKLIAAKIRQARKPQVFMEGD